MLYTKKHLKRVLLLVLLLSFNHSTFAQAWVDSMTDPNANFFETQKLFNEYFRNKSYEKGKGWKQFKRWEYFMKSRVDSSGKFTHANDSYQEYQKIQKYYSTARLSQGTAGNWTSLGPNGAAQGTGAGRLNCIAFHPTNSSYIIAGAASGGVWVTTNSGSSWTTYTDNLGTLGISSIAFAQSNPNIAYAATGDGDGKDTYSVGVIKSTDAGKHWKTTGFSLDVTHKRLIYKVLIDPADENIVYATSNTGIWKTTDGGTNWTRIRVGSYRDMEFKPGDPSTIYFATTTKILKTSNAGSSFSWLTLNLASTSNRLEIAVTADDANYIYVLASKKSTNGFGGIYRSTNGGASFSTMATSPNLLGWKSNGTDTKGQGWYDLALAVSPSDKNMVFVGGVNIWKSTNGGTTWSINAHWQGSGAPYVHSDIHELKFSPHSTSTIWACADGGAYYSGNNGSNWLIKNDGLQIGQIYRLGASSTVANKIMTGWQDNGSSLLTNSWNKVLGGDGMECIIDYSNNNIMYGSLYHGKIFRSTNGGSSWYPITNSINEKGAWVTPYVMEANNPSILYAGYVNVYRTTNRGNTWSKISNFPSGNKPITVLSVAPSNSQIIYISSPNSTMKTTNGGSSWTNINGLSGKVTYFAIHPTNPNIIWATLGGYTNGKKVMKSVNGGQSWTNISGTLPNLPVNCIVYEKNSNNGIYVGTDVGVYYRDDNLGHWVPFMKNLPNVIVKELEIFYPGNKIRAATYGRSVWESDVYALANSIDNNDSKTSSLKIYPNPTSDIINIDMSQYSFRNSSIRIMNNLGEIVQVENSNSNSLISISVAGLKKGIYFIELQTENKVLYAKFIKQ